MSLYEKHKNTLNEAVKAVHERKFYTPYPEHPKAYGKEAAKEGQEVFDRLKGKKYDQLLQEEVDNWGGCEESPFAQEALNIDYPLYTAEALIAHAQDAWEQWRKTPVKERAALLVETLERLKDRFFEQANATMHTTGQGFMMAFQASGPHANDRALEATALGFHELTRFPEKVRWEKPMGKFDVKLDKNYKPIPKGVSLAIGCSTFPVWNTVPGVFASLVTGNPVIVKPHPKSILPIAIVVSELQKTFKEYKVDPNTVQLAPDTPDQPITKDLAEHEAVKLIDYTGSTEFGDYIESLEPKGKTTFTEKAGVNSVILDSADDMKAMMQNLSFSASLYSGQMCTAPQNFFIPESGIEVDGEQVSYEEVVKNLKKSIQGLVGHPKMGPGTLGAIQNEATLKRAKEEAQSLGSVALEPSGVENEDFKNARTCAPTILEISAKETSIYEKELFGPIILIIKTKNTEESVQLAKEMALKHGAITCSSYCTDDKKMNMIEEQMNLAYTPVTFNLKGPIWVNQNAAFSDFHVTGGNPAGNASFADPAFIVKRFVWVGNKRLAE